jgi:hypothetical protein
MSDGKFSLFGVVDEVYAAIKASDATRRKLLAQAIAAYERDHPVSYYWMLSSRAPVFLGELWRVIELACEPTKQGYKGWPRR